MLSKEIELRKEARLPRKDVVQFAQIAAARDGSPQFNAEGTPGKDTGHSIKVSNFSGDICRFETTGFARASYIQSVTHNSTSIFAPAATPAQSAYGVSMLVLAITLAIFCVVAGLLLFALLRYRHRPSNSESGQEPAQIYGSNQIELSWTVIPILIVVILFLATTRVVFSTQRAPKPAESIDVIVIGHQFWWEYRYPKFGVVTANELHIPVSDPSHPTPAYLTMSSADTDHSFWVPRLAGKMDVIPNKINVMWMDPSTPGLYLGQCAQYCGTQHAKMLLRVYADTPTQFAAWIAAPEEGRCARSERCRWASGIPA
jgi:cytochrome c oxidase subunit 2